MILSELRVLRGCSIMLSNTGDTEAFKIQFQKKKKIQNSIDQLIFIINQNNNKKNSLNFCTMMLECAGIRNPSDVTIWISGSGNSRCPYMSSGTELADWTAAIG